MKKIIISSLVLVMVLGSCKNGEQEQRIVSRKENNNMRTVYIGTYTKKEGHVDGKAEGIYSIHQDPATGNLKFGKTVAEVTNPSFVKPSRDKKNLYAVSELGPGDGSSGYIHSYRIKADHTLEETGKISTEGYAPCYIAEDRSGKFVFVTNYVGGVIMMYKKKEDGSLEIAQKITLENPEASHPHSVAISTNNEKAYVADLGNDRIWIFDLNIESGKLIPDEPAYIELEGGAGPRHLVFSKDDQYLYSINELNSTISAFNVREGGGLKKIQNVSALPEDYNGENSAADIHLHPSGKFLYVSNRGHNSIAAFEIDDSSGALKMIGYFSTEGKTPRNFAISPGGDFLYVANQDTDNVVGFKINSRTGKPEPKDIQLEVMTPVSVEFVQ